MDRKWSWKRTEEVQIDLLDLLYRLVRQWKRILVCALVFAVLAGAGSYFVSKNGGTKAEEADTLQPDAGEPEPVPLTEEEQKRQVEAAWQLAKETAQMESYVQNSVRMQIDPYHKSSVQLIFRIEGADGWMTQKIVEKYMDYLSNDRIAADIRNRDSDMEHVESRFLTELFQAAQKTSGTYTDEEGYARSGVLLSVDVTGRDAAMAAALAADIKELLQAYSSTVEKECARHTLTLLGSEEKERTDSDLLAWQREKRTLLATDQANLKAMTDAFDDTQKALYEEVVKAAAGEQSGQHSPDVINGKSGSGNQTADPESGQDSRETDSQTVSEADGQQTASGADGQQTATQADSQPPDEEAKGSVSILHVLFGFFGGIFAYAAVYACWYLLRDTVKSAGEFRSYYTFPFYGSISPEYGEGVSDAAGRDVYERQKAQILNRIRLSCRKQNLTGLCLAADFVPDEKERDCVESMASQLREWGLEAVFVENISGNISVWDAVADAGNVVMVCRLGYTTHRMVDDAMKFYQENGVAVLGAAVFEYRKRSA